ncbi:flippase-like domain-containing protein [candidate division NPL-UPA2 bacterium]|nr:flippase-like domain-containing protein [candidate division NPL-UPA2 bacterium]
MHIARKEALRKALGFLIIVAIFLFLGRSLRQGWSQVPFDRIRFDYRLLLFSSLTLLSGFVISGLLWHLILRAFGGELPLRSSLKIAAFSQLGKYIPGKVWFLLGRCYLTKREGVSQHKALASTILEIVLLTLSGLMISAASVTFSKGWLPTELSCLIVIPLLLLGFGAIHPRPLARVSNLLSRKFKGESVRLSLGYSRVISLLILYCVSWLVQGTTFFILINSFYSIDIGLFPLIIGIYPLSVILGFLIVITPAGLGVREGVMSYLLKFYLPPPVAIVSSLLARLWATIVELIFVGVMALSHYKRQGKT